MTHSGQQAGSYVLLERIGMGGMAEVFRAANRGVEGFERPSRSSGSSRTSRPTTDFVKMFVDEAKIAVQLQHPNIVEIFDLARAGDESLHRDGVRARQGPAGGPRQGAGRPTAASGVPRSRSRST
jgi:hypothetical protein